MPKRGRSGLIASLQPAASSVTASSRDRPATLVRPDIILPMRSVTLGFPTGTTYVACDIGKVRARTLGRTYNADASGALCDSYMFWLRRYSNVTSPVVD